MFPGPTLLAAVTAIVEGGLNQALALDPAGRQALMTALDAPVQFSVTTPRSLHFTLQRAGDRIQVGSQPVETPGLVLSGRPLAFAALATGDAEVFRTGRIEVEGDTGLAHQFQRALNQLNPDWEAAMAQRIGDVPAHFLGRRIRAAVRWSSQAFASLNASLEEYIHEESRSLPGRRELEATFDDIDNLNLRTERLEARIRQLENHSPETP